jgi:hypothetical protein
MSRLFRQCGILNISQPYRPLRSVTGQLYFIFFNLRSVRWTTPSKCSSTSHTPFRALRLARREQLLSTSMGHDEDTRAINRASTNLETRTNPDTKMHITRPAHRFHIHSMWAQNSFTLDTLVYAAYKKY